MNDGCFLCAPESGLVVATLGSVFAMVGLGPITSTYVIIASRLHCPSLADLAAADPTAISDILAMRRKLEELRGPLLMTEHGRVPVCRDDDRHEAHCFHGHALLFAAQGSALNHASEYYGRSETFSGLQLALESAEKEQAYLLVSRGSSAFDVLSRPLNAPRQLARTLVTLASGDAWAADWRHEPRKAEAVAMATSIRHDLEWSA